MNENATPARLARWDYPPAPVVTDHASAEAWFRWAAEFPGGGIHPEDEAAEIWFGGAPTFTEAEAEAVERERLAAWDRFEGDPWELPIWGLDEDEDA